MRSSRGERKIFDILREHGVPFQEEYEFPDLISTSGRRLRFDFAVFKEGKIDFVMETEPRRDRGITTS